eukprot:5879382-Prymnesium_polylepis.1
MQTQGCEKTSAYALLLTGCRVRWVSQHRTSHHTLVVLYPPCYGCCCVAAARCADIGAALTESTPSVSFGSLPKHATPYCSCT